MNAHPPSPRGPGVPGVEEPADSPRVRLLGAGEDALWDGYLAGRSEATLYATSAWCALIAQAFGHRARRLIVEEQGRVRGVLALYDVRLPLLGAKWISIPFDVGSGGPLADDAAGERLLLARAVELARASSARYLQLRARRPLAGADELGFAASTPLRLTRLEVAGEEAAWSRVAKHHQRSVRTAEKRGVRVRPARALDDVRAFHAVYLRAFRGFGTPPYPWSYFRAAWERLHAPGHAHLLLCEVEGVVVGGMLLFGWQSTLAMKFAVALPETLPLRPYAALYWAAIRLAAERGQREISWGSSTPEQTGLLEFKERWGGTSVPVHFHDLALRSSPPDIESYYDSEGLARRVWKRLPLPVTALLGGPLTRWFC